jgi:hypothetical protein
MIGVLNGLAYEREERHLHPDLDDPQGSRLGVTRQEDDCRAYVERRGWQLASVYEDDDLSAFRARPGPPIGVYWRTLRPVLWTPWSPGTLTGNIDILGRLKSSLRLSRRRVSRWRLCVRAPSTSARQLVEL